MLPYELVDRMVAVLAVASDRELCTLLEALAAEITRRDTCTGNYLGRAHSAWCDRSRVTIPTRAS